MAKKETVKLVTEVRMKMFNGSGNLKAAATVTIAGAVAVHDLKVIKGSKGLFVGFPSKQVGENDFIDIVHPITAEARTEIIEAVMAKYQEEGGEPGEPGEP